MAYITYTAKRRLATGHILSTSYSLEFSLKGYSPEYLEKKSEEDSINGTTEAVLWNIQELWSIDTSKILEADLPLWDEFFASVAAREPFTFDAYGTVASPDNPVTAERVGKSRIRRVGTQQKFIASFKVKVL